MKLSHEIARELLAIKAVQIKTNDYFTWASGIQSPIYCDNRLTMSYPGIRKKIRDAFVMKIDELEEKPDIIAGCATAGIPHAAWLADALNLPMIYVRSKPKGHGKGNQIEGLLEKGQKVLVIEDLISTGGSSLEVVKAIKTEGAKVIGVLAIFTYGLKKSIQKFSEAKINFNTITGLDPLLSALEADGNITTDEKLKLLAWRDNL